MLGAYFFDLESKCLGFRLQQPRFPFQSFSNLSGFKKDFHSNRV
jgi:hypothetical protein